METTTQTPVKPAWTHSLGPIQCKRMNQAMKDASWAAKGRVEITGVIGGEEHRCVLTQMFGGPVHPLLAPGIQAIGDKFGWNATGANLPEIIAAFAELRKQIEDSLPVDDLRKTPEALSAEQAEYKALEAAREAERHERQTAVAAAVAKLRAEYPWALAQGSMSGQAHCAANIRLLLARTFPGVRFSVTSSGFSMGNDVRIGWTDGPTTAEVDALTGDCAYGTFDGMDDSYRQDESLEGEAWREVFGSTKYVITSRHMADDVRALLMADLQTKLAGDNNTDYGREIHQAYEKTSLPAGATITGIELTCDGRALAFTLELPTTPVAAIADEAPVGAGGVSMRENPEKNGIELRFTAKPEAAVLADLKAHGWRWALRSKCWYAKASDHQRAYAARLAGA